jgi:hypothetical protein
MSHSLWNPSRFERVHACYCIEMQALTKFPCSITMFWRWEWWNYVDDDDDMIWWTLSLFYINPSCIDSSSHSIFSPSFLLLCLLCLSTEYFFTYSTLHSFILHQSPLAKRLYFLLQVDLPEIKGNHRKFRTLVTSYIGKTKKKFQQMHAVRWIYLFLFLFYFIFILNFL